MSNYPLLHEHKGIQYRRGVPDDHVVVDAADVTTCLARIAALESDLTRARKERDAALARTAQVERIVKAMNKWLEDNQEDVFRRGIWDAILEALDERGKG